MKNHVILFHDGAVDELVSILMAAQFPGSVLDCVVTVNGDCLAYPTARTVKTLLTLIGHARVPVGVSDVRAMNAFPWSYRSYALSADLLPQTSGFGAIRARRPNRFDWTKRVRDIRRKDPRAKITLLNLGGMTPIAHGFKTAPKIIPMIDRIVWMGGVYTPKGQKSREPGNIDTGIAPGANPYAEWNAYWDPDAVERVWKTGVPFVMFPLNVTNSVVLTPDVLRRHFIKPAKEHPLVNLAAQMYAMVAFQDGFSFWDSATTAYLGRPDLYKLKPMRLKINTGPNPTTQGTISLDKHGHKVTVATGIKVKPFYAYLIKLLKEIRVKG